MRGRRAAQVERLVMVGYVLIVCWVLLGRPDLRVKLLYLARKALRGIATGAATAAQEVEDAMLDIANNRD